MKPIHRTALAAILGLAVVAGLLGLTRTLDLGAAQKTTRPAGASSLARRSHQLDRVEASLGRARASRPPVLPTIPTYPAESPAGRSVAPRSPIRQVTYVRPPPHVVIVPRAGGEPGDHRGGSESQDD